MEEWPESVIEAGRDIASMRADHDRLGPIAVQAGRRMIMEWLTGLSL
jgi:GMP synthase (glutamine-hydrolysing)